MKFHTFRSPVGQIRKHRIKMKKKLVFAIAIGVMWMASFAGATPHGDPKVESDSTKGWKKLFNGKDLTGWKHVGDGFMTVEDGIIQTHGGMGLLYWAGEKLGHCTIRIVFRMQKENSNSGFFIRIPIE